MIKGSSKNLL